MLGKPFFGSIIEQKRLLHFQKPVLSNLPHIIDYIGQVKMSTLVGREEELNQLESFYGSSKAEFLVLYGRRIGKTFVICSPRDYRRIDSYYYFRRFDEAIIS